MHVRSKSGGRERGKGTINDGVGGGTLYQLTYFLFYLLDEDEDKRQRTQKWRGTAIRVVAFLPKANDSMHKGRDGSSS